MNRKPVQFLLLAFYAVALGGVGCSSESAFLDASVSDIGIDSKKGDGPKIVKDPDTIRPDTLSPDTQKPDTQQPDIKPDAPSADIGPLVIGTWVTIQPGTFNMGSLGTEKCRNTDETEHQVTLTHSFEIQAHETTQQEFKDLMKYNAAQFTSCGMDCPVETANWHEAVAYCNMLSAGKSLAECYTCSGSGSAMTCEEATSYSGANVYNCPGYRLCTEAEWEYAYRAGTTTALYNGDITNCTAADANAEKIAWYSDNSNYSTHSVGKKQPNKWGLFDMAGNVWEWCHDWYQEDLGTSTVSDPWGPSTGQYRVLRGGAYVEYSKLLRAARRTASIPGAWNKKFGFRCCRTK
ncbi:MAG: formylglycine-generating enzyme family protein [Pseudomonadota bacterium]